MIRSPTLYAAIALIVLALMSVGYGVYETHQRSETVQCNKSILRSMSFALRIRDDLAIASDRSAREIELVRQRVIFAIIDGQYNGTVLPKDDLAELIKAYREAGQVRINDLDLSISRAALAPILTYSCLNGDTFP